MREVLNNVPPVESLHSGEFYFLDVVPIPQQTLPTLKEYVVLYTNDTQFIYTHETVDRVKVTRSIFAIQTLLSSIAKHLETETTAFEALPQGKKKNLDEKFVNARDLNLEDNPLYFDFPVLCSQRVLAEDYEYYKNYNRQVQENRDTNNDILPSENTAA